MRRFLICLIGLTGLIGSTIVAHSQLLPLDSRGGQVPGLSKSQSWSLPQALRQQTLTDGNTVAVPPGGGAYFLTLTQATTISCPVALANVLWMTFDLTQGAGGGTNGWQVTWDKCYGFPSFSPPVLTRDTGAVDSVSCYSVPTSFGVMRCGFVQTVGYGFLVRTNHTTGALCTSSNLTCGATISNSVAGDLRVIGVFWGGGSGGNPVAADITTLADEHGNTCAEATGAFGTIPASTRATDIWYCQINTGGSSSTPAITWGSNVPGFSRVFVVEVAGGALTGVDAGLGNHNSGTGTSLSVSSTGGMPQQSNFVFSMYKSEGGSGGLLTAGANTTLLDAPAGDTGSPDADAYQIPTASGSVATNVVTAGGSQGWSASIAVFNHK